MKRLLLVLAIGFSTIAISQKGNTSSAGIAYRNYMGALAEGDLETAVKELKDAKEFIDKSFVHDDTKDDPKTLMYYGKIYISLAGMSAMSEDEDLKAIDGAQAFKDGVAALKRSKEVDAKGRYHDDVNEFCAMFKNQSAQQGIKLYEEEKWLEAGASLYVAGEFSEILGTVDTMMYFYGGLALYQADSLNDAADAFDKCLEYQYQIAKSAHYKSEILQKQGKADEAEKMLNELSAKYPEDKDLLIEKINLYIGTDRKEEAIKALDDAIALDPTNVQLIYTAGTIYENMEDFENAEKSYLKAIELAPNDANVLSALGGVYFNRGAELNNQANKLEFGDPNYDKMVADSKEYFNKSIPYLEKAVAASPEECTYKMALRDAYGKAGDVEKYKDMKQKAADCQGQ